MPLVFLKASFFSISIANVQACAQKQIKNLSIYLNKIVCGCMIVLSFCSIVFKEYPNDNSD